MVWPQEKNELFSNFKYTRLEGFGDHNGDGTISRRDPTKIIRVNGKYHIWYTHRHFSSLDGITNWKYRGIAFRKEESNSLTRLRKV